ncbi:hypothetical protein [Noviherbaspirillum galbum]|uniref:Collagen-like protein n=1 Tax=Noviherbaspirillum galbum TaxID=2709383 RepID=A0A6B3SZ09_9BURK|nr:hypothetical protein [Noviherbaspirillum galbum]NEX63519.1 hypothetical protein [Noviherbaspirillum galbum]
MISKKRLIPVILAAMFVTACGGGSDSTSSTSGTTTTGASNTPATTGTTATPTTPATTGSTATPTTPATGTTSTPPTTGATGTTGTPGATGTTTGTTPATTGTTATGPASDAKLAGFMEMVANQILYIRTNRVIYLPVGLNVFEGQTGIVDIASGSAVTPIAGLESFAASQGCNAQNDGVCGVQPTAAAPAAPLAGFGIRLDKNVLTSDATQQVAGQKVVGRIGFDLTELSNSPGIAAGQSPEIMRFILDNVEMATNAAGQLDTVNVQAGAKLHVYGKTASGAEIRTDLPLPQGSVKLIQLTDIPDRGSDTGSQILYMDLEKAFSQAGQSLAGLEQISGHFAMHVTFSSFSRIFRPAAAATAEFPAVAAKDLVGSDITVNSEPTVSGAGINGTAWIRMFP